MRIALLLMVAAGMALGMLLPVRPPAPLPAEAPVPAEEVFSVKARAAPPPRVEPTPVETVLQREDNGHFYAYVDVNEQPVHFVVDTGASMVALTVEDAKRIGITFDPAQFEVIGSGASGPVRGQMIKFASVSLEGKRVYDVSGAVVEGLTTSLLGQAYLTRIRTVQMSGDTMKLR